MIKNMKINLFMSKEQYDLISKCSENEKISVQDFILKSLPSPQPRLLLIEVEQKIFQKIKEKNLEDFSIPQLFTKKEFKNSDSGSHTSVGKQLKKKVTESPYFIEDFLICFTGTNSANLGFYCIVHKTMTIFKKDGGYIKQGTVKEIYKDGKITLNFGKKEESCSFKDFGVTLFSNLSIASKKFPEAHLLEENT